jgi:hypothetical protein
VLHGVSQSVNEKGRFSFGHVQYRQSAYLKLKALQKYVLHIHLLDLWPS